MKKICPFHKYDFMQIIQWLNEQSAYGWQLEEWGTFFVKFSEGMSKRYQYQIDMDDSKEEANYLRREELEKGEWKYVLTIPSARLHIYRSENMHISIPKSEYFCEYNRKKLQKDVLISSSLFGALIAVLLVLPVLKDEYVLVEFMQTDVGKLLFYVLWTTFLFLQGAGEIWHTCKLRKCLSEDYGDSVLQVEREDRNYGFLFPAKLLEWIVLIFSIVAIFWTGDAEEFRNLSEADASVKYVDLAAFQAEGFEFKEISWEEQPEVNFGNRIEYINALLCDRYYEINQYGTDAAGKDEQMEGLYWMGVSGKLGSQLFEQVFERYTTYSRYYSGGFSKENKERYYIKEHWKITEYQKTGFEELIVAEGTGDYNGDWMLFAKTQDEVIVLRYWGEASGEMLMEAIVDEYS